MDKEQALHLLTAVKNGTLTPEEVLGQLTVAPFEELGYAKVDTHRGIRQGVGEVIYGQNKTPEQLLGIAESMIQRERHNILVTRLSEEAAILLKMKLNMDYYPLPKIGIINPFKLPNPKGLIVVVSAGTSDMAVAEEAALTAEALGSYVERVYDAGVSGIHRLLSHLPLLGKARVVIAVAGMEGALASVVGGLVSCPVIAVPTSVGYGASFNGLAALLTMLNSCASGVSVVNIDNGFGAGYQAHLINKMEGLK